jgi:hypothetical protein
MAATMVATHAPKVTNTIPALAANPNVSQRMFMPIR